MVVLETSLEQRGIGNLLPENECFATTVARILHLLRKQGGLKPAKHSTAPFVSRALARRSLKNARVHVRTTKL